MAMPYATAPLPLTLGAWRRDQAPWQARAATFAAAVTSLGECMGTRHSAAAGNLWRAAAVAFNAVVAAGLPAVNIAYVNKEVEAPQDAWPALAQAFSTALLGGQPQQASAADESMVSRVVLFHHSTSRAPQRGQQCGWLNAQCARLAENFGGVKMGCRLPISDKCRR